MKVTAPMVRNIFVTLVVLLSLAFPASINANYNFIQITNKEGLPHQQVEDLMQDSNGFLWIGTRNGLAKYDGYSIETYFHKDGDPNSLPHNTITGLFQDSQQRIWVGTNKGICRYLPESNDFKCYLPQSSIASYIVENHEGEIICADNGLYTYDEKTDSFVSNPNIKTTERILSLTIDKNNRLFYSTNNSISFIDFSTSSITQISPSIYSDFLAGADDIVPLLYDSEGRLWIGRNGKGVMWLNADTNQSQIYAPEQISDGTVRVIAEDNNHNIWLGTENGVTIIAPDGSIEIVRPSFTKQKSLNDNAIYAIMCDNNDNIWIGTYFGGINVLFNKTKQFEWIKPGYDNYCLKGKAIRNIIEPEKGKLWIASEDGGINIYDCASHEIKQFDRIPSIGNNIHDILLDRTNNTLWIGTFRKGLYAYNALTGSYTHYDPKNTPALNSDAIFSIKQQHDGTIWLGTTQGLRYFDYKTKEFKKINHSILDNEFVYCVYIDRDDNIWAGTTTHGLYHINSKNHEIKEWHTPELKDVYITCLYQDSKGTIWIGTNNSGIQYILPNEMKIRTPDEEIALPSATICGIVEDFRNKLWVSSNTGLYKIDGNIISKFTTENGLPSNQFNFSSAYLAQDSLLYFGSINGLVMLNPEQTDYDGKPMKVFLKCLNINDIRQTTTIENSPLSKELNLTEEITLSNEQSKSFNIEYIAISLGNTESIKYQVRLLGMENSWRDVGSERKFVGSNLPAGTYTLQIRANNNNSNWDVCPIKSIKIIIEPPFYLSVYAIILYVILVFALLYLIISLNNKRQRNKNKERMAELQKKKHEEFNQIKFEFFTSVSHELKTPLSMILAPLKHISQHKSMPQDVLDKINIVIKSALKMGSLIDELITFSKVESGIFRFYIQKDNPIEFIKNITDLFKENAYERQLTFEFIGENNGELVWYSPLYVESIINNLISNAFKFTPAGGSITTKVSITEEADGYTYLHIEVADTGIGIVKEECENIFNRYYQTKRGHSKDNKGWGLGLALIKNLATIHKGNVSVKSTQGQGSTFIVNLNVSEQAFDSKYKIIADSTKSPIVQHDLSQYKYIARDQLKDANDSIEAQNDNTQKQYTILVVEDDPNLSQFLYEIFIATYNVLTAENGKEAIECIADNDIDCIISDIMMPEMDGFELCKYVKSTISTSHIPIVLLSAKNDEKDVLEGMECGADNYIYKPFDPQILKLQIKNILFNKKTLQDKLIQSLGVLDKEKYDNVADNGVQLNKLDQEFIESLNKLIEQNLNNDSFSIADITSAMGVSRSLLHIKMKKLLNISTSEYIRKKRLRKACEMLANGYSVSETAYSTGFADPNYFSKSFKKEFNITPSEFQNRNSKSK